MLSDYERRVVAEFEAELRADDFARRAARTRVVYHARIWTEVVVVVAAMILAVTLPVSAMVAAILMGVAGPLLGLAIADAMRGAARPGGGTTGFELRE